MITNLTAAQKAATAQNPLATGAQTSVTAGATGAAGAVQTSGMYTFPADPLQSVSASIQKLLSSDYLFPTVAGAVIVVLVSKLLGGKK